MNHSFCGRTRKKKSLCGPITNGIPVGPESRNTMWTDYQRHPGRTRKKKSLCGPSTNGIPVGRESRNTMWTDYQRHPGRTRKKKSLCGPSTNGIPVGRESRNTMWTDYQRHRQSHNSRGSSRVFYRWHRLFSAPRRVFFAGSPSKIISTPLYTCEGITLIFFPFSGSRHPPFVFVDC